MTQPDAKSISHSSLAMISYLLEENAPLAALWLPEDPNKAQRVLEHMRQVGLEIAALAQAALTFRQGENCLGLQP